MTPHPIHPRFVAPIAGATNARALVRAALWLAACSAPAIVVAQPASLPVGTGPLEYGLVLDGAYTSREIGLAHRERGFGLGHAELSVGGRIDDLFSGRLTAGLHHHQGDTDVELEEAFIDTRPFANGLQLLALHRQHCGVPRVPADRGEAAARYHLAAAVIHTLLRLALPPGFAGRDAVGRLSRARQRAVHGFNNHISRRNNLRRTT